MTSWGEDAARAAPAKRPGTIHVPLWLARPSALAHVDRPAPSGAVRRRLLASRSIANWLPHDDSKSGFVFLDAKIIHESPQSVTSHAVDGNSGRIESDR